MVKTNREPSNRLQIRYERVDNAAAAANLDWVLGCVYDAVLHAISHAKKSEFIYLNPRGRHKECSGYHGDLLFWYPS